MLWRYSGWPELVERAESPCTPPPPPQPLQPPPLQPLPPMLALERRSRMARSLLHPAPGLLVGVAEERGTLHERDGSRDAPLLSRLPVLLQRASSHEPSIDMAARTSATSAIRRPITSSRSLDARRTASGAVPAVAADATGAAHAAVFAAHARPRHAAAAAAWAGDTCGCCSGCCCCRSCKSSVHRRSSASIASAPTARRPIRASLTLTLYSAAWTWFVSSQCSVLHLPDSASWEVVSKLSRRSRLSTR
mmetsp:Transcript_30386/g.90065  ORF Transcript_30386/g.90065 Transcript_30386/m.90065 type:complete len:249 (-) Transcript_30386:1744-2490(-)